MIRLICAIGLALLSAAPALADELRPASIHFEQRDAARWALAWKQPLAGNPGESALTPSIPAGCTFAGDIKRESTMGALIGKGDVACPQGAQGGEIGWPGLIGQADAIMRVAPLDRPVQVYRLTASHPQATIAARPEAGQVWRSYFVLGVEHILAGWDHLLFVIALVLLVGRGWAVVKAATAFTIAHSLTLAVVTLGFAGLPQRPVEAMIALSIVFLALEIVRAAPDTLARRLPWVVAFAFGLLHGFGFASALHDIGLPEGEVPAALVSFNLGVEAGQLLVIAAVIAALAFLRRFQPQAERRAVQFGAYAIGITGSYWLIDRMIG